MALKRVGGIFPVLLLLSVGCWANSEGNWCYDQENCGPSTWKSIGHCGGERQSPINIISSKAITNSTLGPVTLIGYDDSKKLLEMKNTGKTVDIELGNGLILKAQGLPDVYTAKSFHLHWGNGVAKPGSEHHIDGRQYSMELHIVHTRNGTSISDALEDPQGITVLAFFVQGYESARSKTAKAWESFAKSLQKVDEKGKDTDLDSTISLRDLLGPISFSRYYRYSGSLTTPGCNEVVTWILFTEPILIPSKVVALFPVHLHTTDSPEGPHLQNNFRPLQEINDRKVEASAHLMNRAMAFRAPQPVAPFLGFLFIGVLAFSPV